MQNGDEKNLPDISAQNSTPHLFKKNAVAIYTLLVILTRIKNTMGLEAMLEYIEHYKILIERHNPEFRDAVAEALTLMSVEKMYRDIKKDENS